MPKVRLALAVGLFALLLCGAGVPDRPAAGTSQFPPGQPASGKPRFINARVETRAAGTDPAAAFAQIVAAQTTPAWVGYSIPAVPGEHGMCDSKRHPARVYLEGRPDWGSGDEEGAGEPEESRELALLFRAEAGRVQRVRVCSTDCEVDAGGLPVAWLDGMSSERSVAMLLAAVTSHEARWGEAREDSLVMAIALHRDPSAEQALEALVAQDRPVTVRKRAAFWLGAARGAEGFQTLRHLIGTETDSAFRRELVFPISLSRRPEATDVLIQAARSDRSVDVRKQAMFWLGQKAGRRAAAALSTAATSDSDTEVKKRAVFGLSRMPNGEGVPHLIEIARTNANPEVRRQAMFWLGRSGDPRALDFLVEFLK